MPKGQISADSQKSVRRGGGWERVVDKEPHKMREIRNSDCSKYIIYHIICSRRSAGILCLTRYYNPRRQVLLSAFYRCRN